MKRLHTLLAGIAVLGMAACSEQQPGEYALEGDRLNFTIEASDDYGEQLPAADITDEQRTYAFSFVYGGDDVERDTVWFEATIMGDLSKMYRPYCLQQIQREGVMNAEPGVHYVAFDDPEVQDLYRVAPDSNTGRCPSSCCAMTRCCRTRPWCWSSASWQTNTSSRAMTVSPAASWRLPTAWRSLPTGTEAVWNTITLANMVK